MLNISTAANAAIVSYTHSIHFVRSQYIDISRPFYKTTVNSLVAGPLDKMQVSRANSLSTVVNAPIILYHLIIFYFNHVT